MSDNLIVCYHTTRSERSADASLMPMRYLSATHKCYCVKFILTENDIDDDLQQMREHNIGQLKVQGEES